MVQAYTVLASSWFEMSGSRNYSCVSTNSVMCNRVAFAA
jgi:hypothetical protein